MKKRILPFLALILITSMGMAQTHTLLVTVPDSVVECYVASEFNDWNPVGDTMIMISESPKVFSLEYEFDGLVDTLEYKFLAGPDWVYQQKQTENFVVQNDSATAVVDTFNAIWRPEREKDVTIEVLVPSGVYELYLTGNFNAWSPSENPMEQTDSTTDNKVFELTIHTIDTAYLEFKFIAGPGWPYEQTDPANYKYMDGASVVCEDFKKIFDPTKVGDITINITSVPEGTPAVWLIGSWGTGWKLEEAIQATDNGDGTYTAIIPQVADIEYKCWNYPEWAYEEASDTLGTQVPNRIASFETGPEFEITVAYWAQVFGATGIKDPISAVYKMYTTNGTIVVEGVNSNVVIFDLYGRLVQNVRAKGTFVSKTLRTGLYIVRVDNMAQKIVVR